MSNYEDLIHHLVVNEHIGSADVAILFHTNGHALLRMGLAETWVITRNMGNKDFVGK
ncbi:hypothetical protein LCGC14_1737610 [marine sediment metagenome]|uniref:Uncharacterized protein n=1 Tax=marine sediment metagenome TaxID=412755 RepID=A0A0F9HVA2_9ZZZZ